MSASVAQQAATALAGALDERARARPSTRVMCGFDGFVDEMISVVGERQDLARYAALGSIADLGEILVANRGRSTLREIVVRSQDPGGCAVNLGDGLAAMGLAVDFWGTIGRPAPASFDAFAARCAACTALGTVYGRSLAFVFGDGLAMFSAVEQLRELDPGLLASADATGALSAAVSSAELIALTNWTLYPHMTACWAHLQAQVLPKNTRRPWLVVDLVDPSGRSRADIARMLDALGGFQACCRTVLGLNLTEVGVVSAVLGLPAPRHDADALASRADEIKRRLGIEQLMIHHAKVTAVADADGAIGMPAAPLCEKPKKTTGAGDRFNAGYCLGLVMGLPARQRLALGSASGGFFVRNARSGTCSELAAFCRSWSDGSLERTAAATA